MRSIAELQDSIRKINATSSERFSGGLRRRSTQNFTAMFARLFQGGAAEMRLLDENDLLESGVEIIAQPPGKRNQSILLLSGGEKALTAIALLMAIFRYKPSPFCILDEVDAPLDEANIDRFTRLLREMTEETQFIAITHNKRTMETADVDVRRDHGRARLLEDRLRPIRLSPACAGSASAFDGGARLSVRSPLRLPGRRSSVGRAAVS